MTVEHEKRKMLEISRMRGYTPVSSIGRDLHADALREFLQCDTMDESVDRLDEFAQSEVAYLKRYLDINDTERADNLFYTFPHSFAAYLGEVDESRFVELGDNSDEVQEALYDLNPTDFDRELIDDFYTWFFVSGGARETGVEESDLPAWSYLDFKQFVRQEWLVHFTANAYGIEKNGFTKGVSDMQQLGLTTHLGDYAKSQGGYNFAYRLHDFSRYGKGGYRGDSWKYGDEAVIFKATGVLAWHNGDDEPQVIFSGKTAKNIVAVGKGEEAEYAISGKNGQILFENDDLERVAEWVESNWTQYRPAILGRGKGE